MAQGQVQGKPTWTFRRFFVVAAAIAVAVLCAFLAWSVNEKQQNIEARALAEARTLNTEINAAWDYIGSIQDIPDSEDGEMALPHVYCSIAAKNIAKRFSEDSDYTISYVRENPRNTADTPDDFEQEALDAFASGDVTEYYAIVEDEDGTQTFRYVSLLTIERSCLSCHGEVAGTKDVTGYLKEGMEVGDIAGAVSIVMPLDASVGEAAGDLVRTIVFFVVLMGAMGVLFVVAGRHWVTRPILAENERVVRESEEQSRFLAVVSHELKTPLASILAYTELWRANDAGAAGGAAAAGGGAAAGGAAAGTASTASGVGVAVADAADDRRIVEEVETNSRMLLDMVNNLLDAARLEAGSLELREEEVDACDLTAALSATMQPLADQRGIALAMRVDSAMPVVRGDAGALHRIAANLLSNALRYTDAGGRVDLRIGYDGGRARIEVADTGRGIAPEQLPHIFERFSNAPGSERTNEGGTGLGLYIVKSYVDMMGGTVQVESEPGRGSRFVVEVPLAAVEPDPEPDADADADPDGEELP